MMRTLLRLRSDVAGNFAIITALLIVPFAGVIGLAIDFSRAMELRDKLYGAADAAALGAISEKSNGVALARQMVTDGQIAAAVEDAKEIFRAQLPRSGVTVETQAKDPYSSESLNIDVDVKRSGQDIVAEVNFKTSLPTTFLKIIGKQEIVISGAAKATYQLGSHIDFYMLLDNTPSMGVGATATDIATLEANTSDSCAFACHETKNANNYYNLAKKLGVSMRVDTVRQATQQLTQTAKDTMLFSNQYRMGVYTFGEKAEDAKLTTVSTLNGNMDQVKTYASAVDLMTIPQQGYNNDQQTSFDSALTEINKLIDKPGTGDSSTDRQKVLFFVSDGVGDSYKPSTCTKKTTGSRCQEPIDVSFCKPIKDRGIRIAILYTTYLPLPKNSWYNSWIKPFQSEISTKMQECATPGLFFEVSPTQGISQAMETLFRKVINSPRLQS